MTLSFRFSDTTSSGFASPVNGVDFHAPTMLLSAFGYLLVLNGVDENRKIYDPARRAGEGLELLPLVSDGPVVPILPMTNGLGEGRMFGHGYLWIYRYYDSRTGNCTGFSPFATELTNMGDEVIPGSSSFVGQTAYFYLAGISTTDTQFDRFQLFRNTSGQQSIFFLNQEVANPGNGSSVLVIDDYSDDEITSNTTGGLLPNPSVQQGGVPWPCAKAHALTGGRVLLYGLVRHPPVRVITTATNGENTVFASTFLAKHVGRRFLPMADSGGTAMTPSKGYHIAGRGGNVIYPDWAEATATSFYADVIDDRDLRVVFVSEPGLPCQYDVTKTLYIGRDQLDGPQHIFELGTTTFAILYRRIVALQNINSLDPSVTVTQTVVAEEGQCGLHAGAETPLGYVYVNEKKGVRLFNGSAPMSLGSEDPRESFLAKSQFAAIEPAYLEMTRVFYDSELNLVLVSYCPTGCGSLSQVLAFDVQTQTWRGPWRESITMVAQLVNDDGSKKVIYGDASGNILTSDESALDVVLTDGATLTGTVTAVDGPFIFRASAGTFDSSSDRRIVGRPIILTTGSTIETGRIAGYDTSTGAILLQDIPVTPITTATTFSIGAVRWQFTTTLIDAGEPKLPKELDYLSLRFELGASGASPAVLSDAIDGSTTFLGEDGTASTDVVIDGAVHAEGRLHRTGRTHQIRMAGTSTTGDPQISEAVVLLKVDEGA